MKLSRTAWLILGIGIFVIAFATLYMVYSRQSGEQEQLNSSLSAAQAQLPKLIAERGDLEDQLSQWESELAEATLSLNKSKAEFPKSVESIEYDEALFDIADGCDLEILSLTASKPRDKKVEDITYATTTFVVKVEPAESPPDPLTTAYIDEAVANILDMVNTIATSEQFTSATAELVNINIPEPEEEGKKPEATIRLVIYGYQGE